VWRAEVRADWPFRIIPAIIIWFRSRESEIKIMLYVWDHHYDHPRISWLSPRGSTWLATRLAQAGSARWSPRSSLHYEVGSAPFSPMIFYWKSQKLNTCNPMDLILWIIDSVDHMRSDQNIARGGQTSGWDRHRDHHMNSISWMCTHYKFLSVFSQLAMIYGMIAPPRILVFIYPKWWWSVWWSFSHKTRFIHSSTSQRNSASRLASMRDAHRNAID